jgi:hypothetical protein
MSKSQQSGLALLAVSLLTCVLCSGSAALIAGPSFGLGVAIIFGAIVLTGVCSSAFTWLVLLGSRQRRQRQRRR